MNEIAFFVDAADFAAEKHRHQRRKGVERLPYINHPLALARVLAVEAGIDDTTVLVAAVLHDTVEDTATTGEELRERFGDEVAAIVLEVTDDKSLPSSERKRLQIEHAPSLSRHAKLVKYADKICNLRDMVLRPPKDWSLQRRQEYFDWAKAVIDGLGPATPELDAAFALAYAARPKE
ncbi:MAG TPA: HD domain-containing protein [Burkholderiaceae bacterium]|jgi:GTP diphosphokinase / guanosine-3',5'-bis(diphosphate) 3'-diphosphatase|nr:HD domain-containing protein [Burkholderiaceae bacterium]